MIKKYVMLIAVLLVILMFTSTSNASFLSSMGKMYEMLPENSAFRRLLDRFSQVVSNTGNSVLIDDEEENDDEDDDLIDTDGPEEDVLLPKIWDLVGEKTPDDGNEPVDDSEETPTVNSDSEDGVAQDTGTVDSNGEEGTTNEKIIVEADGADGATQDEWTVDHDGEGGTLERFVKIIMEHNGNLGAMLQRVIKRTVSTDENGISPGSGGTAENNKADVIVLTDSGQ